MKRYSFRDKVVLLTGATGGVGRVLARRLVEEGSRLVVTGRDMDSLTSLIESLPDPRAAVPIDGTLTQPGEAARLADEAPAVWGRVDCLVNNAGLGYFALVEEATEERVRELFELNTFVPLILAQRLLPEMKARGEGRIVNIASAAGRVPIPSVGIYGGSKSALAILANTMRIELEGSGVTLINIYPGTIATAFEVNALSENERAGLDTAGRGGRPVETVVGEILEAMTGPAREVWLERPGRWMAGAAIVWPSWVERRLAPMRERVLAHDPAREQAGHERRWRLWQVETSMACNLDCVMCPWKSLREQTQEPALMTDEVWDRVRPHLPEIASVDFTGGGEPTLHPLLADRVAEARTAGCRVGFLTNGMGLDENLARRLIELEIDWITFSIDAADAPSYEAIRRNGSFETVTANIRRLATLRRAGTPRIGFNVVMMPDNADRLEAIVELAAGLGADQISFKQCDVVRGERGQGFALFQGRPGRETRAMERRLDRARKRARRLGLEVKSFSFSPDEQPVCEQDPRASLFIGWDGRVAPCINQAYGGPTCFFGQQTEMPTVTYGSLLETGAEELWENATCRGYRDTFAERVTAHDRQFLSEILGGGFDRVSRANSEARKAMVPPPKGCEICHYLYDV